jgi:hypothetical protein
MDKRNPANNKAHEIVEKLSLYLNPEDGMPVQAMLIVRTIHPNGEVGLQLGVSDTATWFDNLALITAADTIIKTNVEMFVGMNQYDSYLDDEDTSEQ